MSDNEILEVEAEQLEPLGSEEEFAALVERLVLDEAPRVFALVEEVGERADAGIVAWGMALRDRAELVAVGGGDAGQLLLGGERPRAVRADPRTAPGVAARGVNRSGRGGKQVTPWDLGRVCGEPAGSILPADQRARQLVSGGGIRPHEP
ncbi:hypothetical protein [Actinopolyspora saharensis]|uniref:Uncharacterized protein n=1 Tax=Actinopolyspora saharensis TaxID=995062 RepID=A0A1H1ABD6_9ACTN|nr:hypothetical protein [Actinopolyspora saharensis]SDQ36993.1 hypothetical protein SAMN04489718_1506 [Actinopolyspora saharensis]